MGAQVANRGISPTSDTTLLCQVDMVLVVKRSHGAQRVQEGVASRCGGNRSACVPGSAPTAQWTAPAPLTSSLSQSLNQADSRASSLSKSCCHSAGRAPPPTADVTILHINSKKCVGPPP